MWSYTTTQSVKSSRTSPVVTVENAFASLILDPGATFTVLPGLAALHISSSVVILVAPVASDGVHKVAGVVVIWVRYTVRSG
jgi:hypothetical protein